MYDPSIARWNGVDTLAERYIPLSPYAQVANNPLIFVDIDGNSFFRSSFLNGSQGGHWSDRFTTEEEKDEARRERERQEKEKADNSSNQEKLRRVDVTISGDPITDANGEVQYGYVSGYGSENIYEVPLYKATVKGTNNEGDEVEESFTVVRFGVTDKKGKTPFTNGLADQQTHISRAWLDDYLERQSYRPTVSKGAWFVYGNFLLHDGTDYPTNSRMAWATDGCVEFCGVGKFDRFNELIVELSGTTLTGDAAKAEIAKQEVLYVTFQKAKRPAVKLHKKNP